MSQVSTPYRFVPLSKLVLLPDWADQVSHDQPFVDGLCGELKLRLTCHTPLCVGGEQDKKSGQVHFFRTPDQQLAIPGSSLKGMLRNVLEIASFARFKQVEDQRLGVRDISQSNNFYAREIVSSPVHAGWLTFIDGQWQIQHCEFSRLHQEQLIEHCKIGKPEWKTLKKAVERYEHKRVGICPEIRFNREAMPKKADQGLAIPNPNGSHHGRIVVTGQPGPAFDGGRSAKKYEFVFHDTSQSSLPVAPEVMTGFRQIHEDSEEWKFWSNKLNTSQLPQGIPVFFHKDGERVKSLGLAMMYKLPYKHSLHDAIRHTHDAHLTGQAPDLPDLIFGCLGEGERGGLRGRVSFGLASLTPDSPSETQLRDRCILNAPKPTFYPAYIRQDGKGGSFRQLMEDRSELAGWKRYPVKDFNLQSPQGKAADNLKTQVKLETVKDGTAFTTTLRFHNLRRVELGALLWTLDFGDSQKYRHALGMGKPFGLGQIGITIEDQRLRANDPGEDCQTNASVYLHACRREFIDLMEQTLQAAGQPSWEASEPIKALLEHAKPARNTGDLDYLPTPKDFVKLRNTEHLDELRKTFHEHAGITPDKGFDTTQPHGHASRFAENLQQAAQELERQAQKAELEQKKANATPEESLLMEISDLRDICLGSSATSSQKDNLAKLLNKAHATSMDLDDNQKTELRQLAGQCSGIDNKKIQQACKKILRDV
ncbi:TIGR03986 family CRISPR-associated RAMP protein [Azotobacter vinelandii]|uniref:TIGR03986 family type III CRISPR-associated RAMP protein n=1 Tax=Azotobacter vinelandii TaxID=354 RepID=UPI002666009C|nr:TIGR03986 family CRISPR-associated RAMP protein [Azotobacter vinelandii]WKN24018.1 TIGR03986 family CRISPR-associated RAMP protein [Azotobacter vinelandii]